MLIGKLLHAYLQMNKPSGMSVRSLAEHIGMDYTTLWRATQGKTINHAAWIKLMTWVLIGDEPKPKSKE